MAMLREVLVVYGECDGGILCTCQKEIGRQSSLADDAYDGGALRLTTFHSIWRRVKID